MLTNSACPICACEDWMLLGKHRYIRHQNLTSTSTEGVRDEIFFNLWLKVKNEAILVTNACRQCGFVSYMPRPEHADIVAKYHHLETHSDTAAEYFHDLPSDGIRSRELFRTVRKLLPTHGAKILDFGGGKGRLLYRFIESRHVCFVSDYVDHVIDGAHFLGSDLDTIAHGHSFDLVICSHVIEHVADPVRILRKLASTISPNGHLYVEVPLELWKHIPPTVDPITHINFFTRESLKTAIEMAGYNVIDCYYETFVRPNSRIGIAIKAIACLSPRGHEINFSGTHPVTTLIQPSIIRRIGRLLRHPRLLKNLFTQGPMQTP